MANVSPPLISRLDADDCVPAAKRPKASPLPEPCASGSKQLYPLSARLLDADSRETLRKEFDTSSPYTHCVLKDFCDSTGLQSVRDEILNNIQATYKETDLFKVFQTGDLGNLDKLDPESAAKLPTLNALKSALYSDDFRRFVQAVTGCGPLSSRTDCSCNVYAQGGHLLCHDDVIGTRRVSYIIYLTDPEDPWLAEDGGALELYPQAPDKPFTPAVCPSHTLLPTWNTMAMFTVQPGRSFHSVQEVFVADKPRMSISGWYHAEDAPEGAEVASLMQLQLRAGEDAVTEYQPLQGAGDELSDEDLALLIKYINPIYLADSSWAAIQKKFEADGSVQLQGFLKTSLADRIRRAAEESDSRDCLGGGQPSLDHAAGCRDGWTPVGPPHKQRYVRYDGADAALESAAPGPLLSALCKDLFSSTAFARLLNKLTTLAMVGVQGEVRRFRPGLDYTVAHYGILTQDPRLDVVLCFVDSSTPEKAEAWDCGEVGGFEAYLLADEDAEGAQAAEVYRQDADESGVINVSAAANSLNLVLRDEGLMKFLKYISFQAPSSRWDVCMEFKPADDDDEEEETQAGAREGAA